MRWRAAVPPNTIDLPGMAKASMLINKLCMQRCIAGARLGRQRRQGTGGRGLAAKSGDAAGRA